MINQVYQLVQPKTISVKYADISFEDRVIIRPTHMALCHADQRYYYGQRDVNTLREKLPMALIHECCGEVLYDPSGKFAVGEQVALIPNVPNGTDPVIFENYARGSRFLSSGRDGFMREFVDMDPQRIVSCAGIDPCVAAITEFVSVALHAIRRFSQIAHPYRGRIGIWGSGSLAYVVAAGLKALLPESRVVVVGRSMRKLSAFSFADETYLTTALPEDLQIDHAFECCGGEGSYAAVEDIIRYIRPQGAVMLMGVSENRVPINTRMVLEKGLTMVGCSRSGLEDFEQAVALMKEPGFQQKLKVIIYEDEPVRTIGDIHRVFTTDVATPFKTVFRWDV